MKRCAACHLEREAVDRNGICEACRLIKYPAVPLGTQLPLPGLLEAASK